MQASHFRTQIARDLPQVGDHGHRDESLADDGGHGDDDDDPWRNHRQRDLAAVVLPVPNIEKEMMRSRLTRTTTTSAVGPIPRAVSQSDDERDLAPDRCSRRRRYDGDNNSDNDASSIIKSNLDMSEQESTAVSLSPPDSTDDEASPRNRAQLAATTAHNLHVSYWAMMGEYDEESKVESPSSADASSTHQLNHVAHEVSSPSVSPCADACHPGHASGTSLKRNTKSGLGMVGHQDTLQHSMNALEPSSFFGTPLIPLSPDTDLAAETITNAVAIRSPFRMTPWSVSTLKSNKFSSIGGTDATARDKEQADFDDSQLMLHESIITTDNMLSSLDKVETISSFAPLSPDDSKAATTDHNNDNYDDHGNNTPEKADDDSSTALYVSGDIPSWTWSLDLGNGNGDSPDLRLHRENAIHLAMAETRQYEQRVRQLEQQLYHQRQQQQVTSLQPVQQTRPLLVSVVGKNATRAFKISAESAQNHHPSQRLMQKDSLDSAATTATTTNVRSIFRSNGQKQSNLAVPIPWSLSEPTSSNRLSNDYPTTTTPEFDVSNRELWAAATRTTEQLLLRNQTLVKEVRFADQTCVELAAQNHALQQQIQQLLAKEEAQGTTNYQKSPLHPVAPSSCIDGAREVPKEQSTAAHQETRYQAKQIQVLQGQVAALELEKASVRNQVESSDAFISQAANQCHSLQSRLMEVERECNEHLARSRHERQELDIIRSQYYDLQSNQAKLQLDRDQLEHGLHGSTQRCLELESELLAARSALKDIHHLVPSAQALVQQLENIACFVDQQLYALEDRLSLDVGVLTKRMDQLCHDLLYILRSLDFESQDIEGDPDDCESPSEKTFESLRSSLHATFLGHIETRPDRYTIRERESANAEGSSACNSSTSQPILSSPEVDVHIHQSDTALETPSSLTHLDGSAVHHVDLSDSSESITSSPLPGSSPLSMGHVPISPRSCQDASITTEKVVKPTTSYDFLREQVEQLTTELLNVSTEASSLRVELSHTKAEVQAQMQHALNWHGADASVDVSSSIIHQQSKSSEQQVHATAELSTDPETVLLIKQQLSGAALAYKQLQADHAILQTDFLNLRHKVQTLQHLEEKNTTLQDDVSTLHCRNSELSATRPQIYNDLTDSRANVESLKATVELLDKERATLKQNADSLRLANQNLEDAIRAAVQLVPISSAKTDNESNQLEGQKVPLGVVVLQEWSEQVALHIQKLDSARLGAEAVAAQNLAQVQARREQKDNAINEFSALNFELLASKESRLQLQTQLGEKEHQLREAQPQESVLAWSAAQNHISFFNEQLAIKENALAILRDENNALSTKCERLKQYILKITSRCDEWKLYHGKIMKLLNKIRAEYRLLREKAAETSRSLQTLANLHTDEKSRWIEERESILSHHQTLEKEMDSIAEQIAVLCLQAS